MTLLATWRKVRRIQRIEAVRAKMRSLSNKREKLRGQILDLKRELLALEQPEQVTGQNIEPRGFEVER